MLSQIVAVFQYSSPFGGLSPPSPSSHGVVCSLPGILPVGTFYFICLDVTFFPVIRKLYFGWYSK